MSSDVRGKIVGYLGADGAGKSTVIDLAQGQLTHATLDSPLSFSHRPY